MQIPKHTPSQKKFFRYCQYAGCEREFRGRPMQKYCEFHMDPRNRKRVKPKPESPAVKNRIFLHNFTEVKEVEFTCALEGCITKFRVKLYPRQHIYPKFCEKHRSEFSRERFKQYQSGGSRA